MPSFSKNSIDRLATCHLDIQRLFNEVIKDVDCTILVGHRNEADQEEAFRTGKSRVHYPDGKHNKVPSEAADVAPYFGGPIDWEYLPNFYYFAGIVKGIALKLGIKIRWGGDWNGNLDLRDNGKLNDLVHFELAPAANDKEVSQS